MQADVFGSMVRCRNTECSNYWNVSVRQIADPMPTAKTKMDGTLYCAQCQTRTIFEYAGGAITRPSDAPHDRLSTNVPEQVKDSYSEAVEAYYGRTFRASATMARTSVEEALVLAGVEPKRKNGSVMKRPRLDDYISEAKTIGVITDIEETAALGAKLIGNGAIHQMNAVPWNLCLNALATTVDLLEHIAAWQPSASKSTKGNSGQ